MDFRLESPVHRTAIGDLEQTLPLALVKIPAQPNDAMESIHLALLCFARLTISGIDLLVLQADVHLFQRPLLAPRVHAERHRSAAAECREEVLIGSGSKVGATNFGRLVSLHLELANPDILGESGSGANDADGGLEVGGCGHGSGVA